MLRSRGALSRRLPLSAIHRALSTAAPSYASEFASTNADLGQELPPFILSLPNLGTLLDPHLALPSVRAASRAPRLALRSTRAQTPRSQPSRPRERPLVLDGAMADPLAPGFDIHIRNAPRPTLAALLRAPALVRDVHLAYIAAGADILTTCNFSVDPAHISHALPRLPPSHVPAKLAELAALSGKVAEDARTQALAAADAAMIEIRKAACVSEPFSGPSSLNLDSSASLPTASEAANASAHAAVAALCHARPDLARFAHLALPGRCDVILAGCLPPLSGVHPASVAAAQAVAAAALAGEASHTGGAGASEASPAVSPPADVSSSAEVTTMPPPVPSHALASAAAAGDPDAVQRVLSDIVVAALAPFVDCYLCESLTCIQHAEVAALSAMAAPGSDTEGGGKPVWVSWRLNDTDYGIPRLFSCETLAQAVDRLLHSLPRFVDAYLFNCSSPSAITASLPLLRQVTRRPIGAYARLPPTPLEPADHAAATVTVAVPGAGAVVSGCGLPTAASTASAASSAAPAFSSSPASGTVKASASPSACASTTGDQSAAPDDADLTVDVGERHGRERSPASPLLPQPHWLDGPGPDGAADAAAAELDAVAAEEEAAAAAEEAAEEAAAVAATSASAPADVTRGKDAANSWRAPEPTTAASGVVTDATASAPAAASSGDAAADGATTTAPAVSAASSSGDASGVGSDYTATLLGSAASRRAAAPLSTLVRTTQRARTRADSARAYAALAARWSSDLGADVIGGCCGVGLLHVRRLAIAAEAVVEGGKALQTVLREGGQKQ